MGDVDSALADYEATSVASAAERSGISERVVRDWFDQQLITGQGIRAQVLQETRSSAGLDNQAISNLIDAHLVRAEQRRGAAWYELTHDRLIAPIRADNARWTETNLSTLQRQAALWESQSRAEGLLLRGAALEEAEAWAAAHEEQLKPIEQDFLLACRRERERARRETRKNRIIFGLAVVSLLLAGLTTALGSVVANELSRTEASATAERASATAELAMVEQANEEAIDVNKAQRSNVATAQATVDNLKNERILVQSTALSATDAMTQATLVARAELLATEIVIAEQQVVAARVEEDVILEEQEQQVINRQTERAGGTPVPTTSTLSRTAVLATRLATALATFPPSPTATPPPPPLTRTQIVSATRAARRAETATAYANNTATARAMPYPYQQQPDDQAQQEARPTPGRVYPAPTRDVSRGPTRAPTRTPTRTPTSTPLNNSEPDDEDDDEDDDETLYPSDDE